MAEFFDSPLAAASVLLAATLVLVAVGAYLVAKVRANLKDSVPGSNEMLTEFRDLHSKGELSDEEYRTIKAMLAERIQQELKDNEKHG
jgi:hypothetical protein